MSYRITYVDTSLEPANEQAPGGTARTEDFPTEPAALARARELLEDVHYRSVLVSDGTREPLAGVCLQLKVGLAGE